jgi:PleD family two-component response regulator
MWMDGSRRGDANVPEIRRRRPSPQLTLAENRHRSRMCRMTPESDQRRSGADRRRLPRGGRRADDAEGYAPLVLVADDDEGSAERCEAILAALHFAVAPAHSVEEALRVMHALRPELVVSHLHDHDRFQSALRSDPLTAGIPLVRATGETEDPQALVDEIRRVLREQRAAGLSER